MRARKLESNLDVPLFLIAHIQSYMKPCYFYLLKDPGIQSFLFSPPVGMTIFIGITVKASYSVSSVLNLPLSESRAIFV